MCYFDGFAGMEGSCVRGAGGAWGGGVQGCDVEGLWVGPECLVVDLYGWG